MAGILPDGGVPASQTTGATATGEYAAGCNALFYRTGCNVRMDPNAMNGLISEVVTAVTEAGLEYDCSRFDNLSLAIMASQCAVPQVAANEFSNDDYLTGCINGQAGAVRIGDLFTGGGSFSLCALGAGTPDSTATLAGCMNGNAELFTIPDIAALLPVPVPNSPTDIGSTVMGRVQLDNGTFEFPEYDFGSVANLNAGGLRLVTGVVGSPDASTGDEFVSNTNGPLSLITQGQWRCQGYQFQHSNSSDSYMATIWLRIA